jgi:hypothetical protein
MRLPEKRNSRFGASCASAMGGVSSVARGRSEMTAARHEGRSGVIATDER